MTEFDQEFIKKKFDQLDQHLSKLQELKALDEQTYLEDYRNYSTAELLMQQSIEIILDICRYLIIQLELPTPSESRGLFTELQKSGILSEDLIGRNLNMVGFRNRLVHEYEIIDHKKTYDYLQKYFVEFEKFKKQISQFILKQK